VLLLCDACERMSPGDAVFCIECGAQLREPGAATGETVRL
jgi:rRNA maturation endonuclease Nob1